MTNELHCPQCGAEFEITGLMRAQLTKEVRTTLEAELHERLCEKDVELEAMRTNLASVANAEAELLKKQRALEATKHTLERDLERRLAEETQRVREEEAKAAKEHYARETCERLRSSQTELAEMREKLAAAGSAEAELLKRQRELDERERTLGVDVELRIAEETARIREREAKIGEERIARETAERLRAKDVELAAAHVKLADAAAHEARVLELRRDIEDRERRLGADVEQRVAEQAKTIRQEEAQAAAERYRRGAEEEMRLKDQELADARERLSKAAEQEALMLRKERELEDRARAIQLDIERKVSEEAKRIREQVAKVADEQAAMDRERQRLLEEEHRQQIDGMKKHIGELQRRAQQGSQQLQGEAQEVLLRDLLVESFADDDIGDVPKGVLGADALHRVRAPGGGDCGSIVWESKRTKAFCNDWLAKARDDQRSAGAACAVIVTQAMPTDVRHFGLKDGVWVCAWPYAAALGAALRASLVEVALARRSAEGRGEKMQMLYEYLTGTEFRNRVGGFVEAFKEMQEELESEKRAVLTRWKRRERLMQRARDNITAFYGDLQGIAGRQLRDLPSLALDAPQLPTADSEPENDHAASIDVLKEILFALVPEDGSNAGNGSLLDSFTERALSERGILVRAEDYERCKAALLADGRIRRARGKGGSVCRA